VLRKRLDSLGEAGRRLERTEREAYSIDLGLISLDIDVLNEHLDRAEHAAGWTKRQHLEAALEIGAGELLAEEPYADWAIRVRDHYGQRLREQACRRLKRRSRRGIGCRRTVTPTGSSTPIRWNEAAYRQLMVALVGMGRRPDAVQAFRRLRDILREDMDLEPDRLTVDLFDQIRTGADVDALISLELTPRRSTRSEAALDKKMQILLVEDNPADIRLFQESIREAGRPMDLEVATDGEAALAHLRSERPRPDLVLLDLNLPSRSCGRVTSEPAPVSTLRRGLRGCSSSVKPWCLPGSRSCWAPSLPACAREAARSKRLSACRSRR